MRYIPVTVLGLALLAGGAAAGSGAPQETPQETPAYVGSRVCRPCHIRQYRAWEQTKMAQSFNMLMPGQAVEQKQTHGLDPQHDYTTDETCLPCHTTGYGQPGGYQIPAPDADAETLERLEALKGTGCEMCHGPGGAYCDFKRDNREYRWPDVAALGLRIPVRDACIVCHNERSPFVQEGYVFDFDQRVHEGTHEHVAMRTDHGCDHQHHPSEENP